jgi:hypothetical protein
MNLDGARKGSSDKCRCGDIQHLGSNSIKTQKDFVVTTLLIDGEKLLHGSDLPASTPALATVAPWSAQISTASSSGRTSIALGDAAEIEYHAGQASLIADPPNGPKYLAFDASKIIQHRV